MSKQIKRLLLLGVALVSAGTAVWFALLFSQSLKEYRQGEEDLRLVKEIRGETPAPLSIEKKESMDEASLRAALDKERREKLEGYKRLKERNSDMIGWVKIEGTEIDYPVMQTPKEPDFYLRRGFDKKYSVYGMIYMDATCTLEGECPNYILYGHHMKNGSMFASIEKYSDEAYFKEHPVIEFDTLEGTASYEVVGVFKIQAEQMDSRFAYKLAARTKEDYEGLIEYIKANDLYRTGITAEWPEQLVTLTTCEYTQKNGRFFVIAKKKNAGAP